MGAKTNWPEQTAAESPFWVDVVSERGWRVQYNKALDKLSPLRPYRLLDPGDVLWMSADSESEMAERLPALIEEHENKPPLLTGNEVKQSLLAGLKFMLAALARRQMQLP